MHQLAAQIRASYYDLVRMKQQIEVIERSIDLNQALLDLASQKLTLGAATELEVLQATTQLNADSSQLVILQGQLSRAKVTFNRLLGIPPAEPFEVTSEYPETVIPNVQQLIEESKTLHPDLQLLRMDEQITDLQVKELKGDLFPTLSFAADYNYSYSKSDVGFLLSNRSFGPSFTLTATYDLFHGRNIGKDLQNIELLSRNLQLDQRNIEEDLHAQIREAYTDYLSYRDLFLLEERNIETASRNAELAREMYERGVSTDYEVREALLNEVRARDRMIDAEYRMKLAEITLLQLAGRQLW
jgi:outer membrane protein